MSKKTKGKVQRKWGETAPSETEMASLDFSIDGPDPGQNGHLSHDLQSLVDKASLGRRTGDGLYEVKDWDFNPKHDDITRAWRNEDAMQPSGSLGALSSMFARLTGSKALTEQDLKPVLEEMKQHLMKKNVAMEIADKVCEGVGESLVGKKVGGFQSMSCIAHLSVSLLRSLSNQ